METSPSFLYVLALLLLITETGVNPPPLGVSMTRPLLRHHHRSDDNHILYICMAKSSLPPPILLCSTVTRRISAYVTGVSSFFCVILAKPCYNYMPRTLCNKEPMVIYIFFCLGCYYSTFKFDRTQASFPNV